MTPSLFEKFPKSTLTVLLFSLFIVIDLALGLWFCPRIVGETDAYYHHDLPASFSGEKEWGSLRYRLQTNSLGFKDDRSGTIPRQAGKHRILILGDSFTEGVGYPHEETFSGRFEQRLRDRGMDVDVQNAGVLSYSPKLYYHKVKYLLFNAGLQFDELVVFLDMSDIQDEVRYVAFTPSGDFGLSSAYLLRQTDSFLKQHSFSYYSLRRIYLTRGRPDSAIVPLEDLAIYDQEFLDNWAIDRIRWAFSDELFQKWGAQGVALAQQHMDDLHRLCQDNGVRLTIAIYPWPRQIMERQGIDFHVKTWTEFAAQRKIPLLNYFPLFLEKKDSSEILRNYYIPGDVHWNQGGHQFVADKLAEFWLQQDGRREI